MSAGGLLQAHSKERRRGRRLWRRFLGCHWESLFLFLNLRETKCPRFCCEKRPTWHLALYACGFGFNPNNKPRMMMMMVIFRSASNKNGETEVTFAPCLRLQCRFWGKALPIRNEHELWGRKWWAALVPLVSCFHEHMPRLLSLRQHWLVLQHLASVLTCVWDPVLMIFTGRIMFF